MTNLGSQLFKTERLMFRLVAGGDEEIIFQYITDGLTKYWIGWEKSENIGLEKKRVNRMIEQASFGEGFHFMVFDLTTKDFIGMCGIEADAVNLQDKEIDIWVKQESQGKGYAMEMVSWLILWVKQNTNLSFLVYSVTEGNSGSKSIAQKLGLMPFRTFTAMKRGEIRSVIDYKLFL